MKLNQSTIKALLHKSACAQEQADQSFEDEVAEWLSTRDDCESAANVGTVEYLAEKSLAKEELANYLDCIGLMSGKEFKEIRADLCRAGFFEVYNPKDTYTRRPSLCTVDGVRYCV